MPNIQAVAQKPRTVNSECVVIFTRKKNVENQNKDGR